MGQRIWAQSLLPNSSSPQSPVERQLPDSSAAAHTPIAQSLIDSMSQSYDASVQQSLKKLRHYSFVITDPHLQGNPIVYASDGFLHMSGYLAEEVMGRNPKFLQGPETDRQSVFQMRDSVCEQKPCLVTLCNYTKQGWPFQTVLHMAPVFSQSDGRLMHFVGAQTPLFDGSPRAKKHAVQGAPTLLALEGESYGGCFTPLPYLKAHLQSGTGSGSRKKMMMKASSTVLQLVIHELSKSSELKSAKVLRDRVLSENAETALSSSLTLALSRIQQSFFILNPNLPGMPVIYASDKFSHITGYPKDEVIGHNCRFLHGLDTDARAVQEIRDCIKTEKACTVQVIDHRRNGLPFWNLLHVAPIRDHTAKIAFFVCVQWELGSDCCQTSNPAPVMQQLAAVGAVKVAVRSLQGQGLRRSFGP